ncbi:MAG: lipoate--protein ligase family protein [Elusimicrobia bacterium]|nr:lipoate--protein ligase family protein [Elusimicrobiota bacterium]
MHIIDITFNNPVKNIEYDEELLKLSQNNKEEAVRFWEPKSFFVSLGRDSGLDSIYEESCKGDNIPVVKRNSGGGTVLLGPGCLNYSIILACNSELFDVRKSYNYILTKVCNVLKTLTKNDVDIKGISDITLGDRKISGNAQIRKRNYFLHHGTLLYNFNLSLISKYLKQPKKQPDYRSNRSHGEFLTNINLTQIDTFKKYLCESFK